MPEQVDIDSDPARGSLDDRDAADVSGSEVDPSLVALIRQALDAPRVPGTEGGSQGAGDDRASGGRIGKFEVVGEIGRGGFGTVLLVRDPDLGRERALKLPNPETLESPGALSRFLGEARLASRVDHPNVVRVYEAETHGVFPYIVMEYCPGGSLGRWLAARSRTGPLPQRWVAALVAEIADGVQQAHLAGLLHRDLKPGNILLETIGSDDGAGLPRFRPKIADFGLAKVLAHDGAGRASTATGTPVGTWAYMSPEQARGEKGIRATTDVYAIGAILYELLTGDRLYAGLSQSELLGGLLGPDLSPTPSALRGDLHRDLEIVCMKCLEKAPGERYQNPSEVGNDLRRFLGGLPVLAVPVPRWKRAVSRAKRHPVLSALFGLSIVLVVAAAATWFQFRELKHRGEVEALLNNVQSAPISELPGLMPRIDPGDARVADRLRRLFLAGGSSQKLAAALALSGLQAESRAYCYDRLLRAEPREVAPIARILDERMPDLVERLESDANDIREVPGIQAEARDRRRANAACALIELGRGDAGWSLLRFRPDPQARSFLIHELGPSGVTPARLLDRLVAGPGSPSADGADEVSIRRALLLSLGEVPHARWTRADIDRALAMISSLYLNDRDAGVHGAAKWFARASALVHGDGAIAGRFEAHTARIDKDLESNPHSDEGYGWRIGPGGITLVRAVVSREDGDRRCIEVSDSEITVGQVRALLGDEVPAGNGRKDDVPIGQVEWNLAARFCNKLSENAGLSDDDRCYAPQADSSFLPRPGHVSISGYRMPTGEEFLELCRGNATCRRFFGDSDSLLDHYVWHRGNAKGLQPIALRKPNDLGLFDLLGNAAEWCDRSDLVDRFHRQWVSGYSVAAMAQSIRSDKIELSPFPRDTRSFNLGFRVVRTLVRPTDPHLRPGR